MQLTSDVRRAGAPVWRDLSLPAMMLAVLAACTNPAGPEPSAIVRVEADTIHAQHYQAGSVAWLRFVVPVSIVNTSSASVFFKECWYGVEQLDGGQWRDVWSPICNLGTGSGTEVRPNEHLSLTLPVDAATAGPGAPEWQSAAIAGTYRMTVGLVTGRRDIPTVTVQSDTFLLDLVKTP